MFVLRVLFIICVLISLSEFFTGPSVILRFVNAGAIVLGCASCLQSSRVHHTPLVMTIYQREMEEITDAI